MRCAAPGNLLIALKIPTHFTWQDLKDEIREEASHVGHVEVLPNRTARIALRVWDEAWKCFSKCFLTNLINTSCSSNFSQSS